MHSANYYYYYYSLSVIYFLTLTLNNNQQKTEELIDTAFSNLNPGKIILPLLYATEESN